ncbi:MAG: hypothetical protein AAF533_30515, partial [Acidobacteriota bacterium]
RQVGTLILVATGAAAVLTVVALLPVLGPFAPLAGLIPLGHDGEDRGGAGRDEDEGSDLSMTVHGSTP